MLAFRFSVQTDIRRGAVLARRYLAPFEIDEPPPSNTYALVRGSANDFLLTLNGRTRAGPTSLAGLLDRLLWEINNQAIRRNRRYLLVHAAVASWKGLGLLFPATSGSGKSTLIAALTRAGFDYLSDEAGVIDVRTAELHPYSKVISLEPDSMELMPELKHTLPPEYRWPSRLQYHLSPNDLRSRAVGRPCRVGFVIAAGYERGATTRLEPISRATALYALAENSFNLARFKGRGLTLLGRVVEDARCYRLRVGDLGSAVEAVQNLVQ